MSVQLSWSIEGEKQLSTRLRGIEDTILHARPAFAQAATYLKDVFSGDVFDSKGSAIGEPWAPLTQKHLNWKLKHGYPADILIMTSDMKKSFYTEVGDQFAVIGNNVSYFKYHQSNKARTIVPRRVMMKLADRQRNAIIKIFQSYFFNNK